MATWYGYIEEHQKCAAACEIQNRKGLEEDA